MNTMKKILTLAAVSAGIFVISSCCRTTDIAGEWTVNEVNGETLPVSDAYRERLRREYWQYTEKIRQKLHRSI